MKHLFTCVTLILITALPVLAQQRNTDSSCGNRQPGTATVLRSQMIPPAISFDEHPYNHNMHITGDGTYYYTINGGNSGNGQINKFDLNGNLLQTYPIQIDGRGLSFNQDDGFLYASLYGGDIVRITDLATGMFTTVFTGIMQNQQASFAISPDGTRFYDFSLGTLLIHDFVSGAVINTISNLQFGAGNYGGEAAVAVDTSRIYTWSSMLKSVYIYDTTGTLLQTMPLDSGDNGHSLAIANGYLFVSKDGNYNMGRWYGYNIYGTTGLEQHADNNEIDLYPNPATNHVYCTGKIDKMEIFDLSGKTIFVIEKPDIAEFDVSRLPRGVYNVSLHNKGAAYYRRIILE